MQARAAARHGGAAPAAAWADLPLAVWEGVASQLPTGNVMSLRQAWRGAGRLADARVRQEALAQLKDELGLCVAQAIVAARGTATCGVDVLHEGGLGLECLPGFFCGAMEAFCVSRSGRHVSQTMLLRPVQGLREGWRFTFAFEPHHTGVVMQVCALAPAGTWVLTCSR